MKTTENIDGKDVVIDWQFIEIVERHDSNWCHWSIEGEGDNGKLYQASCFADGDETEDTWSDIEDIEEIGEVFWVQCDVCKQQLKNWVGSTPCCGSIAYRVENGKVTDKMTLYASINGGPIKPTTIE